MGRLTYLKNGRPCVLVNGVEVFGPVAERLHAYEETGYEPGEVHDLADRIGKLLLEKGQRQLEIALEADPHVRIEQTILQHPISWKDIADMAECFAPIIALTGGFNKEYFWNVASAYAEGLLLFLPVAVGGTLYAPWSDPQEGVEGVDKITVEAVKLWTGEQDYDLEDVGRYIFTTREAAEAALKGAADGDTK